MVNGGYQRVPAHENDSSHGSQRSAWSVGLLYGLRQSKLSSTATRVVLLLVLVAVVWLLLRPAGYVPIPLERLLSDNSTPPKQLSKIDPAGQYQRWDGITTVMPAKTELSSAYERAYRLILDNYSDIMTPTPVSSYHVTLQTVINLSAQPSLAEYNRIVTANQRRLERLKYYFAQQTGTIAFVVNNSSFPLVTYSPTVRLTPATAADQARYEELQSTALDILGHMHVDGIPPHLGLGYKLPGWKNKQKQQKERLRALMMGLRDIWDGVVVVVDMPVLSVIFNMTAFPPV